MSDGAVQVRYRGRVTVGSRGRAALGDRDEGISELVWNALAQAEWLDDRSGIRPTIEVCIRVPAPSESRETVAEQNASPRGGNRREGERGRIGKDGAAYQRYEGPLNARAVPGIWLVDSERRAEDFDYLEDMLYTAAIQVGWLPRDTDGQVVVEVPDIEILIGVPRRHR